MAIIYREEKGAPLTSEELDGNFRDLSERLLALETQQQQNLGIVDVRQDGDQLTFIAADGTTFGPVVLPRVIFNPTGAWQGNTPYAKLDVVCHESKAYVCSNPHTSSDEFSGQNWQLLLEVE